MVGFTPGPGLPLSGGQSVPAPTASRKSSQKRTRSPRSAARSSAIRPPTCFTSMTSSASRWCWRVARPTTAAAIAGRCASTPACALTSRSPSASTTPIKPPLDYYLLPRLDFRPAAHHLAEHNAIEFESYRFDSLDYLYGMADAHESGGPHDKKHRQREIRMIPVDKIDVLNPRDRNGKAFRWRSSATSRIGLKKPITVTPRTDEGARALLLICGEGGSMPSSRLAKRKFRPWSSTSATRTPSS
jgi:hypothetical protein